MARTLVIGDIHGGLRALQQVFQKAKLSTVDQLIFLGDYVDGWSDSSAVISYLIQLEKTHACVFIKGNHDEWCEEWLRSGASSSTWLIHGGEATVNSYAATDASLRLLHLNFFEKMPYYHIDDLNRLFIHAGFTSMHGPQHEFHQTNFAWDRTLWETAITIDKDLKRSSIWYPKRLKLFHEIYIGHTPTLNYEVEVPMQGANVWNLDTGAAFTGKLSVMDVDSKQYWQSDPVYQMYKGETGRN